MFRQEAHDALTQLGFRVSSAGYFRRGDESTMKWIEISLSLTCRPPHFNACSLTQSYTSSRPHRSTRAVTRAGSAGFHRSGSVVLGGRSSHAQELSEEALTSRRNRITVRYYPKFGDAEPRRRAARAIVGDHEPARALPLFAPSHLGSVYLRHGFLRHRSISILRRGMSHRGNANLLT